MYGDLTIATPRGRSQKFLAEAGILVPEEIPSDDDRIPLDFTRLSMKGIGSLQSRYAVRHAHAIFNLALLDADVVKLKRDLRIAQSKFRIRHKDELKNISDAMMEDDDEIADYMDRIASLEARRAILQAVAQGYEGIRNAASREISRRLGERAAID